MIYSISEDYIFQTERMPFSRVLVIVMKVLLVNGSPHKEGSTYVALREVADQIEKAGIETEIFQLGNSSTRGCAHCGACKRGGRCVFNDKVNILLEKAEKADGFIFGSSVHYAAATGDLTAALDRAFYAGSQYFEYKPGAAVVCCRRAGSTAALDQINKYFTITNMPIVSSQYWNMVHAYEPCEVPQDGEGMQVMRVLGRNMAWLLKCIELGKQNGILIPEKEPRISTNFTRRG